MPRDAGRNAQTLRILGLIEFLAQRRHGATLEELAREFGVEPRTIRRDLEAIEVLGYGIEKPLVNGKVHHCLDAEFARRIPKANLTVEELTALLLAFDAGADGTPYAAQLASARRKIEQALPKALGDFMTGARAAMSAHLSPPIAVTTQAHNLQLLIKATREHRHVMMGYGAAYSGTLKRYRLEPYRVVASLGAFYLVAWVPSASRFRVFALHRIETLTQLDSTFEPTQALAADPFGHSLGPFIGDPEHVELEFSAGSARYVTERRWHSSQTTRHLPGGSLRLALDVSIDYALKSWILGFGRNVIVLAPPSLVAWHHEEALAMLSAVDAISGRRAMPTVSLSFSLPAPLPTPPEAASRALDGQAPLPFSTDWHPSAPVIVADAHGAGPRDGWEAYLASLAGARPTAPAPAPAKARATNTARGTKRTRRKG